METPAFSFNDRFITELWERINHPGETPSPLTGIGTELARGEIPSREHLTLLLDAVFWASHDREEGYSISLSVIYKQPAHQPDSFCFDRPLALHPRNLVKLAPALENPRAHISIWPDGQGELKIWGFRTGANDFITTDLWVQVLGVGCVLITYGGRGLAALTGNRAVFVDPGILMQSIMPKFTQTARQGEQLNMTAILRYNCLLYIAQAMRAHGHGGTVLAVPEHSEWQRSIRLPITYTGGASFLDANLDTPAPESGPTGQKSIIELIKSVFTRRQDRFSRTREQIREQCSRIARLTAVDGALIMSFDRYTYCFGAKIQQIEALPSAFDLRIRKPVEGFSETTLNISDLGGTRHQSAAQFAFDQPQAVAVVASQDGDVTFFTRDPRNGGLIAVQQAELALLHEGLSGALWNISLFSRMDSL